MKRLPLRRAFFLIPLVLACFMLSPRLQAQLPSPTPDGGYPGFNTAEGDGALKSLINNVAATGVFNTATGANALFSNFSGNNNTATGANALESNTIINGVSGHDNTATGYVALQVNTTGSYNTASGSNALVSNGTGHENTATGFQALQHNTTGSYNTATGTNALLSNTTINGVSGDENTATGYQALSSNTTGGENTASGLQALFLNTTGGQNTASGFGALNQNTTGNNNTATGATALDHNMTGSNNIALGYQAGFNLDTGDNNIDIGNEGVAAEANTIRIGTQGTHTATYIAGVSGGAVTGMAVKVNAAGQLGTAPSSARFKDEIKPMNKASETILALKPVSFRYKKEIDPERTPQFGLVAEDVEKVDPALVARDAAGKPYTVRYDAVDAMLLNEFLKAHRQIEEQQKEIEALRALIQKVSDKVEMNKPSPQMALNSQ